MIRSASVLGAVLALALASPPAWAGTPSANQTTEESAAAGQIGTVEVTAQTSADFATRTVALSDIRLVSSRFPALDTNEAARLESRIRAAMPDLAFKRVPLDTSC